jgi:hypothetical protein
VYYGLFHISRHRCIVCRPRGNFVHSPRREAHLSARVQFCCLLLVVYLPFSMSTMRLWSTCCPKLINKVCHTLDCNAHEMKISTAFKAFGQDDNGVVVHLVKTQNGIYTEETLNIGWLVGADGANSMW